jgi:hypothetical protein
VSIGTKAAVEDPEPDYKCLGRKVGKVRQDRAVFNRQKVSTDIFER